MTTNNLIDNSRWQQRYTHPRIVSVQQAFHTPERGLMVIAINSVTRLHTWRKTDDVRTPLASVNNTDFGGIMPAGEAIIYHDGAHLLRCDFNGENVRDITPDLPDFSPISLSASLNGQMIGFTGVLPDGFSMYTLRADDVPQLLYKSTSPAYGPMLSYGAEVAVIAVSERKKYGDMSLLAFDLTQSGASQSVSVLEEAEGSIEPVAFSPVNGDLRLLAMTNATGYRRPLLWDADSGDRTDFPLEHIEDDLTPLGWSPDGEKILLQQVERAHYKLYVYDLVRSTFDPLTQLPAGTIHQASFMPDAPDNLLLLHESATHPPQIMTISAQIGAITDRFSQNIPEDGHPWRSVEFVSSGNVTVQGWLANPAGTGPFPTVVHASVGPDTVSTEAYHADVAAWVDAGFAWLGVNYRGSSTFGEQFQQAIYGMLGLRESDDLTAGANYLVSAGIAQEGGLFLSGTRYGGFVALLALSKSPDLWAGAMVKSPVTDWTILHEAGSDTLKAHIEAMFGGNPSEFNVQYRNSSALSLADNVGAPVLIHANKADPNLPEAQITDYAKRLQDNEIPVDVVWMGDQHLSVLQQQITRMNWAKTHIKKRRT